MSSTHIIVCKGREGIVKTGHRTDDDIKKGRQFGDNSNYVAFANSGAKSSNDKHIPALHE